jgi:formamidopyrimidine-DNA glycosylase
MPELPEVEVTRRGIDEPLRGARITAVSLGKPLRWPLGIDPLALLGARIAAVSRRGKYLWLSLHGDAGGLLMHLGMSGSLALTAQPGPRGKHDHFEMQTTAGTLRLTDPRRFGAVVWSASLDDEPAATLLARLGAEPFDPTLTDASFHATLQTRSAAIKAVLLSGEAIVGAGNIYACEALFQAGIDPRQRAHRLSRPRCARLLQAVRETLAHALDLGGSTLRDFRDVHGMAGAFQSGAAVYDREGQACPRCATNVRRIVQAQRSTYFCPSCQKR